jgi:hypothetical protein
MTTDQKVQTGHPCGVNNKRSEPFGALTGRAGDLQFRGVVLERKP